MKSNEIYKRFLLKINKNDSNDGVNILPSHFVLMFNSEAIKWLSEMLDKDGDNIKIGTLSRLLETDIELTLVKQVEDYVDFKFPDNFYRHASSFSIASKGSCTGVKVFNFEKKPTGFVTTLADDFSKAHFDFEEAPFIITKNLMRVYTGDFKITKVFATYYREPNKIDIAGYVNINGENSADIDSELTDENIEEILDRVVTEAQREFENAEGHAYAKEREQD